MIFARGPGAPLLLLGLAACAGSAAPPAATPPAADMRVAPGDRDSTLLPPMPVVRGRLAIRVIYPAPDAVVRARDSSFLIGSIGTGDAKLTINGNPVRVWPNGAWLAWIPLPRRQRHAVSLRGAHGHRLRLPRLRRAPWWLAA